MAYLNKEKWEIVATYNDIPIELKEIIYAFFIKDDIDFEKFQENKKANEIAENNLHWLPHNEINCTETFREYFSNTSDRAMGIPDWYYIAYPDVVVWFQSNINRFREEIVEPHLYSAENGPTLNFFRAFIDKYKVEVGKLECSI